MRAYSKTEEELIASATEDVHKWTIEADPDGMESNELQSTDLPEALRILVDLECESRFEKLVRSIRTRMRWF